MEEGGNYGVLDGLFYGGKRYGRYVGFVVGLYVGEFALVEVVLVKWMGYVYGSNCESRFLFSCLHLD